MTQLFTSHFGENISCKMDEDGKISWYVNVDGNEATVVLGPKENGLDIKCTAEDLRKRLASVGGRAGRCLKPLGDTWRPN